MEKNLGGQKFWQRGGRADFVKFYLAPPKIRVAPQMPPKFRDLTPPLHMRGEVISVLSLERRYHSWSRVSAANEGQNMIS